ncbi:uncharacterized protein LOC124116359 [Haliotis rufescens]|uniref:uncharacterized protein LOC124116359 n=1 Tax=Haliotis rufescens TaxID=6454 RepID=UPI00201FA470|nr:uncharacterized protein LOC124116359 [Haliotis rufescens]
MSSQYTMASICFVWFVLSLCLVGAYRYQPAVYYLSDHCEDSSVTSLTKDVRLLMNRFPGTPLQYNWRCAMVFKTEPGNRLRVTYRNLNTTWSTGCVHNSVKIFDTITQRGLNGKNGDCGVHPLNTTYSSYEYMITVMVETDNYTQYGQFDILVTLFNA